MAGAWWLIVAMEGGFMGGCGARTAWWVIIGCCKPSAMASGRQARTLVGQVRKGNLKWSGAETSHPFANTTTPPQLNMLPPGRSPPVPLVKGPRESGSIPWYSSVARSPL